MRNVFAFVFALAACARFSLADNFSTGQSAVKFGVYEVVLQGDGTVDNPYDTLAKVTFTPPSGPSNAKQVFAFYDGINTWRARVYANELGNWNWTSISSQDAKLNGLSGNFAVSDSTLRGRLKSHPLNPRQWITENGRWFLNLNDTAYFLLCAYDGNGKPVADDIVRDYMNDNVQRGITSIRCFLSSREKGFVESAEQWRDWYFQGTNYDRFQLEKFQVADRRMQYLLNKHPDVAVQLILFPLEAYNRDDRFWTALTGTQRERLLRNLVSRFAAYPQVFWLITNDAHYGPTFPNSNAMVREVGEYLLQNDPWQHPRSTGHARKLPFYFGGERWVDYVHIEHAHDLGAQQYAQYHRFAKPVFLGEDRYEQDRANLDPRHMRYWQRRLFWSWLLSGGSTNYGGRWWTVHPYSASGRLAAIYQGRPTVTFRNPLTGLDSVRFIRDYFVNREIDLGQFEPHHELANAVDDLSSSQAPRLMHRKFQEFIVYHPHAGSEERDAHEKMGTTAKLAIDLTAAKGEFNVEWYRAIDGLAQQAPSVMGGQSLEFVAPWPDADVVLRLTQK